MHTGILGRRPVAKKRDSAGHRKPPAEPFGRIELQAEPEWIAKLDEAAKALGVSRSAYIRMACNRQMAADRRDQKEDAE